MPESSGSGNELYIIAGTSGKGGEGDNGKATTIPNGKLTVPAALWKVIVVLPVGSDDVNRINAQTRVITVIIPNTNSAGEQAWSGYRVSVDAVEKQTGYDLLSNVPESVQQAIEAKVDNVLL
nr:DNA/RNA non-specific endonuclease [Spirosoma arboris]